MRSAYVRRGLGLLIAFAPVVLLVASFVFSLTRGNAHRPIGIGIAVFAMLIACFNFLLSSRALLHRWKHGSLAGYKHVSGFPMVGTFVVVVGTLLGFGSAPCAVLGLVAMALDTGGTVWFVIATWKDAWLWDRSG